MHVPFVDLSEDIEESREELRAAFERVMDSSSLIMGNELSMFEREFAEFCGAGHAVGVGNGLDALSLTLRAWGIGSGDEVLVPAQTFIATWLAVSHVGAIPVAVDIDPDTFLMDSTKVAEKISSRTRAIIPVHLYGQSADMGAIIRTAHDNGLLVLEDAAQAHGATYNGKRVGALGNAGAFSFYPTKNLGAFGDGGAIVTNDSSLAEQLRRLRNYGSTQKYIHEEIGYNTRLDELQAAFLRVQLTKLLSRNEGRRKAAHYYSQRLAGLPELILPKEANGSVSVYHLYVVRHPRRDEVTAKLRSVGIHTAIHYPVAPGDQLAYRPGYESALLPVATQAASTCFSLPLWPTISNDQQDKVVASLSSIINDLQ